MKGHLLIFLFNLKRRIEHQVKIHFWKLEIDEASFYFNKILKFIKNDEQKYIDINFDFEKLTLSL